MPINDATISFIRDHLNDDPAKLLLSRDKWPNVDVDLAVNTIEGRKRIRKKLPSWYDAEGIIYPTRLCAEQCSSEEAALRKAEIAGRILASKCSIRGGNDRAENAHGEWVIADLTGGLGVDSAAFAKIARKVLYNEMNHVLAEAARHNFKILGFDNIDISSSEITPDNIPLSERPDLIFLDPSRRDSAGRKVFLLEDCTPPILTLKDRVLDACPDLLIKLSPMADITMAWQRMGNVREIHVNAFDGECKELLLWVRKDFTGEPSLTVFESGAEMTFSPTEEREARPTFFVSEDDLLGCKGGFLFEPGKALSKAGVFKSLSAKYGMVKAGVSTHLYFCHHPNKTLSPLGKYFRITDIRHFDKRSALDIGRIYPRCEVSARNLPLSSDTLRSKMKASSGGDTHVFAFQADFNSGNSGKFIAVCEKYSSTHL